MSDDEMVAEIRAEIAKLPEPMQAKTEIVARILRLTVCSHPDIGAMSLALVGAEMAAGILPEMPE